MILTSPALVNGMVIDFNELKFIKQFIDDIIDHHTLIDIEDPLTPHYLKMLTCSLDDLYSHFRYWTLNRSKLRTLSTELQEFGESLVFVNSVPTSEYLATWISEIIQHKICNHSLCVERHVRLASLKWWESDSSYAEWINPLEILS
jgi:6-pyruvoyl-tetrahydropterin synthase